MPDKKILKGIRPFNQFMFRSCYYHQLMSAYTHFNVDETIVLKSFLPLYGFDEKAGMLSLYEQTLLTDDQLQAFTGVRLIKRRKSVNPIDEIIKAVDRGMPVIVAVDSFELKYRTEVYKKTHVVHYILVYGYCKSDKTFIISENAYENSPVFKESIMPMADLKYVMESFNQHLMRKDGCIMIKLKRVSAEKPADDMGYGALLAPYRNDLLQSYAALLKFCEYFRNVAADGVDAISEKRTALYETVLAVRTRKTAQRYQLSILFNSNTVRYISERIEQAFTFLCGVLYKLQITGKCTQASIEKLCERVRDLQNNEEWLHDFLVSGGVLSEGATD